MRFPAPRQGLCFVIVLLLILDFGFIVGFILGLKLLFDFAPCLQGERVTARPTTPVFDQEGSFG